MINLSAAYCQRCNEMYITEGTYNTFISDKDKSKLESEFILDFFKWEGIRCWKWMFDKGSSSDGYDSDSSIVYGWIYASS